MIRLGPERRHRGRSVPSCARCRKKKIKVFTSSQSRDLPANSVSSVIASYPGALIVSNPALPVLDLMQ
jgi:hypothetical protein